MVKSWIQARWTYSSLTSEDVYCGLYIDQDDGRRDFALEHLVIDGLLLKIVQFARA